MIGLATNILNAFKQSHLVIKEVILVQSRCHPGPCVKDRTFGSGQQSHGCVWSFWRFTYIGLVEKLCSDDVKLPLRANDHDLWLSEEAKGAALS